MQHCGNPGAPGSCSAACGLILVELPVSFHKKLDSLSFRDVRKRTNTKFSSKLHFIFQPRDSRFGRQLYKPIKSKPLRSWKDDRGIYFFGMPV